VQIQPRIYTANLVGSAQSPLRYLAERTVRPRYAGNTPYFAAQLVLMVLICGNLTRFRTFSTGLAGYGRSQRPHRKQEETANKGLGRPLTLKSKPQFRFGGGICFDGGIGYSPSSS
jgi:hypothetical protein